MKIFTRRRQPARMVKVHSATRCDLCGLEWNPTTTQRHGGEEVIEIQVLMRLGFECRDGGAGEKYDVDLCAACFENRLVLALREMGARVDRQDWDW